MPSIEIKLPSDDDKAEVAIGARDMAFALAIADINVTDGRAAIFENGRHIATLTKQTGDHAPFWRVEPGESAD